MLQCYMPTFLQTCKLQAKKLTSSSKTLSFFKGTELLELDLGIFQAIDVRVSVEMPWRPAVPTDKDRKSTSYNCELLWVLRNLSQTAASVLIRMRSNLQTSPTPFIPCMLQKTFSFSKMDPSTAASRIRRSYT